MQALTAARALLGVLGRRERIWLLLFVAARVCTRCALVAVAIGVARAGLPSLLVSAPSFAVLLASQGALHQAVVRASRGALARRVVDRLLATDVLRTAPTEPNEGLGSTFDSLYLAQQIVGEQVPGFVGDGIAAILIGIGGIVALSRVPFPALLVVLAAVALGTLVLGVSFAATTRAAATAARAFEPVYDDITTAAGGRVELVAGGVDGDHRAMLREHLTTWRRLASRSDALLSVAGRAPVAAGSLAIGAAVVLSGQLRGALGGSSLFDAAVAASAVPCFVGAVRNLLVLTGDAVRARPLLHLLSLGDAPRGAQPGAPLPAMPPLIEWKAISFSYEGDAGALALRDVSLTWRPGRVLVLSGPNGSGKSTLLRLLLGLASPTNGKILVNGSELFSLDLRAWRRCIGYLPQRPYLGEEYATVRECMALLARTATDATMRAGLQRVELWSALDHARPADPLGVRVRALSAGQKQRLALARVLCQPTPIVILDEPDANLDRTGIDLVRALVRELRAEKMIAIAAHTLELIEVGDVRVDLADGRLERLWDA